MPIIKPKIDGKDATSSRYDGPDPIPGPYRGVLRKAWLTEIKTGDNAGEDSIVIAVQISEGNFKGWETLHNLQVLTSTAWSLNQFLDSLTDGSDKQKEALRSYFWDIGYDAAPESEKDKLGRPISKFGKKFTIEGKDRPLAFILKKEPYNGAMQLRIDRFVVPVEGQDALESAAAEDDSDPLPDEDTVEESASTEETTEDAPGEDDGDDPWG